MKLSHIGRIAAGLLMASALVVTGGTSASAHAGITSSTPANGSQLSTAPASVIVKFGEKVHLDGKDSRLIDDKGITVASRVRAKGRIVTFTPARELAPGRYAAAWHVLSADGDPVQGAIAFTVATPNPRGTPVAIRTAPRVPTTLSAALPGYRTLFFSTPATSGDVEWTSKAVPEPIMWTVRGSGTKASAKGVLPTSGTWSFTATLASATGVVVVKGKVTIAG